MGSGPKAGVIFRDVFQHTAENAGKLRETIVDDVLRCIRNAERPGSRPLLDDSRIDMGEEAYELLKNKYDNKCDSLLYHGYFSLGRLTLLDGLSWKWTEATGKYIGCQFWSKRAKALLDDALDSRRMDLSLPDAWDIAECLCKRNPSRDAKITHEHVYPRKEFRKLPFDTPNQSKDVVRALFDRLCIGCVVLESEHRHKPLGPANLKNPWMRYAPAGIKLVDNPEWSPLQRKMIDEAGLIS